MLSLTRNISIGIVASVILTAASASAEKEPTNQGQGTNKTPSISDRVQVIGRENPNAGSKKKPEKPVRPNNPPPGADVQDLVKEFKQARETYLQQQKELARRMKEDSKEAREALREQNKELLEQLKEQQKNLRQESRDRAKDLKKELSSDMGRVIDSGVGEGRGR